MDVMTVVFLDWARAQLQLWAFEVAQLAARKKTTFALRNGRQIDTTAETIAEREIQIQDLGALLARAEHPEWSNTIAGSA